jgi:hypothetical protein
MILLSVAIGSTQESHSMKSVSIMVPVLLAINVMMVSAPLLSNFSPLSKFNSNVGLTNNDFLQPKKAERNVSHVFRSAIEQIQRNKSRPTTNVSNVFLRATNQIRGKK